MADVAAHLEAQVACRSRSGEGARESRSFGWRKEWGKEYTYIPRMVPGSEARGLVAPSILRPVF